MVSSGLLRRVALVRTDVSEEPGAYFIRATKIGELGTTQAATCVVPSSPILFRCVRDISSSSSYEDLGVESLMIGGSQARK
jgi:hypothetical protein